MAAAAFAAELNFHCQSDFRFKDFAIGFPAIVSGGYATEVESVLTDLKGEPALNAAPGTRMPPDQSRAEIIQREITQYR